MITEAINIIEVYAVRGQGHSLELLITTLASELQDATGCICYHATRSSTSSDLWIVTGQWTSAAAMEEHYTHPGLDGVMKLLGSPAVSRICVGTFIETAA
ncbi:antibiotic biosynthesis monooxygenase family protein [Pseudomonas sp. NPDC090202]|uniref:antibiotic biosynthesis monooxygenase family protein n=1 Tax=Pseudomonas sp. NPDC090202 TaxID=3364476 RepID=UPI00381E5469